MTPIGIVFRYYTCKILMPVIKRIRKYADIDDSEWNQMNSQWKWVQQEWKTRND